MVFKRRYKKRSYRKKSYKKKMYRKGGFKKRSMADAGHLEKITQIYSFSVDAG